MILDSHISTIRTMLKEFTDDSLYTNEFLADLLVSTRNSIYEIEYIAKKRNFSRFSYNSFCIKLDRERFQDCDCVPTNLGCQVLKSEIELPKVLLNTKGNLLLNVYTINGNQIDYKPFQERRRLSKHPIANKALSYDIVDKRLVLFGNLNLKVVIVEAVWENPFQLFDIPSCDTSGNVIGDNCWDPINMEFPMEGGIAMIVYSAIVKTLLNRTTEDENENGKNDTNRSV